MNNFVRNALIVLAFIGAFAGARYIISAVATKQQVDSLDDKTTQPIISEAEARSQFLSGCDDSTFSTSDFSQNKYCNCVYDEMRQDYSHRKQRIKVNKFLQESLL